MPIIETRPISMNLGPLQVDGFLFVADPPEASFIDAKASVLGIVQVEFRAYVDEPITVTITLPEGPGTLTISFHVPTSLFLCQVQPDGAETEAEWHVLASLKPVDADQEP